MRLDTVKSWSSGRNPTPHAVIVELRALYSKIETAAGELLKAAQELTKMHGEAAEIAIEIASNDREARKRGWPCVGAQRAAYGIAAARSGAQFVINAREREN